MVVNAVGGSPHFFLRDARTHAEILVPRNDFSIHIKSPPLSEQKQEQERIDNHHHTVASEKFA